MSISNITDKLFIKRFCLPIDTDMEKIRKNKNNIKEQINNCICGNYYHMSCVFKGKLILDKGKCR